MATAPRPFGVGPYGTSAYGAIDTATHVIYARTKIMFSDQAELAKTWAKLAPCEVGEWTQEFPPRTERIAA